MPLSSGFTLAELYASMGNNEGQLLNGPAGDWAQRGIVGMGNRARGDASPTAWAPTDTSYLDSDPWNAGIVWFVLYKGANDNSSNTGVKIRNLECWVLSSSTNTWSLANKGDTMPVWPVGGSGVSYVVEDDDSRSYFFDGTLNHNGKGIHGGTEKFVLTGNDIAAVYIKVEHKKVLQDSGGSNDIDQAEFLIDVGMDYWPSTSNVLADFTPMTYMPACMNSRFEYCRSYPRVTQAATIDPPGDNGGYTFVGARSTERSEFENNLPPPLDVVNVGGRVSVNAQITLQSQQSHGVARHVIGYGRSTNYTGGLGDDQANSSFIDTRVILASSSDDLDLIDVLTDNFGSKISFNRVKTLIIKASSANTNDILVGGHATQAASSFFGDVTDKIRVKPGGSLFLSAPGYNGYEIATASDTSVLTIANGGSGSSVTYTILLIGTM